MAVGAAGAPPVVVEQKTCGRVESWMGSGDEFRVLVDGLVGQGRMVVAVVSSSERALEIAAWLADASFRAALPPVRLVRMVLLTASGPVRDPASVAAGSPGVGVFSPSAYGLSVGSPVAPAVVAACRASGAALRVNGDLPLDVFAEPVSRGRDALAARRAALPSFGSPSRFRSPQRGATPPPLATPAPSPFVNSPTTPRYPLWAPSPMRHYVPVAPSPPLVPLPSSPAP
ncbi:uncharacterized protein AMSG_00022 [Thecamonas trahens ATCC 50062]|uniref:Uncharacterized protein n=1 Tax=Thecamonas trahens ATCC 50062 TaxID=461836 RepID=A0A0L0D3N0_THETB|nr:hypothetical protein AMSG_00022 [Thecamonas trahens ATCC 50062]KNC45908.1 hypothetical protein AMSG_00022 [Thecamonas trahens ATCC 50062]|eukprot:XP_013762896.1 hypothetical protein AMSG_00022 [Thecamonas trahens ATCC 50062]